MQEPVFFVAIFPPPNALELIVAVQEELKQKIKWKLTWVAPHRMHVTVFFFGANAKIIDSSVDWALNDTKTTAFEVQLSDVSLKRDRFGDGHRSLFLSGARCEPLVRLSRRINSRLNNPPHVTLARFRQPIELPPISVSPIAFLAKRLALIRSVREGAEFGYHTVKEWELPD